LLACCCFEETKNACLLSTPDEEESELETGNQKKFIAPHIDNCASIAVAIQNSETSIQILIEKNERLIVASVNRGRPLLEMIIAKHRVIERELSVSWYQHAESSQ
jgi:predicted secreted protein